MPLGEEQEELTKNIAQMVLEHWEKVRNRWLSCTDQIIPYETDLYTVLDAIRAILSDYTFFFLMKGSSLTKCFFLLLLLQLVFPLSQ